MSRAFVGLLVAFCSLWPARATAGTPPRYATIPAALRESSVPVLLPRPIPPALGRIRSVAVISAGRMGYYVAYSRLANCAGALSCAFFHVAGYPATTRTERVSWPDRQVLLPDGSRGTYRAEDCSGASCMEASLIFKRGRFIYELDAKVASDNLRLLKEAYCRLRPLQ